MGAAKSPRRDGQLLTVCPGQRNPRTAVFGPGSGPSGVRRRFSEVGVELQVIPREDLEKSRIAGNRSGDHE